jgi:hypothetical protein
MRYLRLCLMIVTASGLILAAGGDDGNKPSAPNPDATRLANAESHRPLPPVLRSPEPSDSIVVRLPGARPAISQSAPSAAPQAVAKVTEPPTKLDPPPPGALDDPGKPYLRRVPKTVYPPNFEKDSALYCQKLIGQWNLEEATMLLGEPHGSRPAFDDRQKENGTIFVFTDPTSRYRQIELDFEAETGNLRTVFGYPWSLTWVECRRQWGANVSAAEANKGRKFYSYLNRRLDVLVDQGGKVISLGLY